MEKKYLSIIFVLEICIVFNILIFALIELVDSNNKQNQIEELMFIQKFVILLQMLSLARHLVLENCRENTVTC